MATKSLPIGDRFARLVVLGVGEMVVEKNGRRKSTSIVKCDCGNTKSVLNANLKSGASSSCGCLREEMRKTHGQSGTAIYYVWREMRSRCENENNPAYMNYGGRRITVCERWKSFENFLSDMGQRPSSGHSLERMNNSGNYDPENCCWETLSHQSNNRRNNRLFTFYGKTMTLSQWSRVSQVSANSIDVRLKLDWTEKDAFWKPLRKQKPRKTNAIRLQQNGRHN